MVEQKKMRQNQIKDLAFKVTEATVKAIFVYLLYFLISPFILPLTSFIPNLAGTIETFVWVCILFMILGELTKKTIFQCFVNTGRAFFIIAYIVFSFGDGKLITSFENFSLTVDLTLFYTLAALFGFLGLARAVLQSIHFMNERAETGIKP